MAKTIVTDLQRDKTTVQLSRPDGKLMEVLDTFQNDDGTTRSEWSRIIYDSSGRETKRLTYYSPRGVVPPARDLLSWAGLKAWLKGSDEDGFLRL